ncbi:MAG: hypothetical protein AAGI23_17140 [Bacteroidota bacterium]
MDTSTLLGIGSRVKHPAFGDGVVIRLRKVAYEVCFMRYGIKTVGKDYDKWEVVEAIPAAEGVSYSEMEQSLIKILRNYNGLTDEVPMGDKWTGGKLILEPADSGLKSKEIPIDGFFHKIVMVRDRLRVMEQRINSSKNLSDEEKVNLQQYLTRIYGSLTTFNVLFRDKEDYFVGERKGS